MTTNIGTTGCARCYEHTIELEEPPRPIAPEDAGGLFREYEGMLVARARCTLCRALYLAWVDERPRVRRPSSACPPRWCDGGRIQPGKAVPQHVWDAFAPARFQGWSPGDFFDLSWRSTFRSEPAPADLPWWVGDQRRTPSALVTAAAAIVRAGGRRGQADWNARDGLSEPPPERTPRRFLLDRHMLGNPAAVAAVERELAVLEVLHLGDPA